MQRHNFNISVFREKETHLTHLRNLEEELDAQVAHIEAQAREEARAKFELEKRNIEEKMEAETAELQAHLRLFQKVNSLENKLNNNTLYKKNGLYCYQHRQFYVNRESKIRNKIHVHEVENIKSHQYIIY
jgi:septal ring factor EnvC (AmiA/AmiB activator)